MTDLALILIAFPDFILGILSKITIFCDIFLTVLIIILSFKYKKYFPSFLAVAQTGLVLWYELSGKAPEMNSTFYIDRLTVILLPIDAEINSISDFFPSAMLYENEMKELFGVNIKSINPDYNNKFYRIAKKTPFKKEVKDAIKIVKTQEKTK